MEAGQPLQLSHSWPLFEQGQRFDLGMILPGAAPEGPSLAGWTQDGRAPASWGCDLADNALTWSTGVYELFGLPRGAPLARGETVALYAEHSRASMERLRAYAIKHRRGFTLDAEIRPIGGGRRWMRLIAAPVCERGIVVRLNGLKQDVSHEYL